MNPVRKIAMPVPFEDRTIDYEVDEALALAELQGNNTAKLTGKTNPDTWKLMKEGYVILRNYIPKEIIDFTLDSWKRMELDPEMAQHLYLEEDIIFESPKDSLNKSNGMWCSPMGVALHRWLWNRLKSTIDLNLQETYSYTRKYHRGAYLKAHADRPSCEISATLCLDYKTDDSTPWSIWVDNSQDYINYPSEIGYGDTQGIPIRQRKTSKRIDLEVGDVLLYQGPNVAHWREYFLGEFSYHVFCHFYDKNTHMQSIPNVEDMTQEIATAEIKGQQNHYFPCRFDGRASRYLPIDEDCWERRLYNTFMEEIWQNDELWLRYYKSDYVNRYREFKQVVNGKRVPDNEELFKMKDDEEGNTKWDNKERIPRKTPT